MIKQEKLQPDELLKLPRLWFRGSILIIDTKEQIKDACNLLSQETVLGFDTETKPAFQKGQSFQVALLQLANNNTAYLFRLNKIGLPAELLKILSSPKIKKIGVAIKDDIKTLRDRRDFSPHGFVELTDITLGKGIVPKGLRDIAALVLQGKISKKAKITNWEAKFLSRTQIAYAATDAWAPLEIYLKLI